MTDKFPDLTSLIGADIEVAKSAFIHRVVYQNRPVKRAVNDGHAAGSKDGPRNICGSADLVAMNGVVAIGWGWVPCEGCLYRVMCTW